MPIRLRTIVFSVFALLAAACTPGLMAQPGPRDTKIEPYTGPPVFLNEGETPPPPALVETKLQSDKYENGKPRLEREVSRYSDDSFESNGVYREYFENGQLFTEGRFTKNDPVGEWVFYHENGEVAKKVTYVDGKPDGVIETLDPQGRVLSHGEYAVGKRKGDWVTYAPSDDESAELVKVREEHYADGKPTGVWKTWRVDGSPAQETPFEDGVLNGVATEWDEAGDKRAEITFVAGKRDGLTRVWRADGKVVEQTFDDGRLTKQKAPE
ncbi:MORN repeat variant [Pirellulimonas nuda]|uniref:MORN repeat variant n=1 Tax=Pirellulimonas nuda TaxID=2528009 RepID=A0A518DH16_9BACT|nr:toxin-antitoxin system YwqK family antitoxin [Pirellulimonas nuda]QDU90767.1 MORN repeat variant [Pirellulimonas nuda]